jgi:hypothetical protein
MPETANITEIKIPTINMGRSRSSYFPVIKTLTGVTLIVNEPVNCINPKTKVNTTGIVTKYSWTIVWNELPAWAEALILWGWGIPAIQFRQALIASDPAFSDDWAIIVLIRETI